jgi:hypothetical protein
MRVSDLQEAGDFADFSTQATDALDKVAKLAGGAYSKFRSSKDSADSEIKSNIQRAQTAAERAAEKAAEKAERDAEKGKDAKQKALGESIPQLVAQAVVSSNPGDPELLDEFKGLDAKQFNEVYAAIDKAKERLSKFPREMRKALSANDFLQKQNKSNEELNDMLGAQPPEGEDPAEEELRKNMFDQQAVWENVLTSDDGAGSAQQMVQLIKAISRDFQRRNQAATGSGGKSTLPEGTGLVKIMSTQRQVIARRLIELQRSIDDLSSKPITEAALRRVRRLLERM